MMRESELQHQEEKKKTQEIMVHVNRMQKRIYRQSGRRQQQEAKGRYMMTTSQCVLFAACYGDTFKQDEINGACSTHGRFKKTYEILA
jgi:hypothetical protein